MPEITITTEQLASLAPVLSAIESLTPPPTASGRYALAKVTDKAMPAFSLYAKQDRELMKRFAKRDEKDKPILRQMEDGKSYEYTIAADKVAEYAAEKNAILAETVTLSGVRPITHGELGACPITVGQERVLISLGLLTDDEPGDQKI